MRKCEMLREFPKCDTHKMSRCCWKLAPTDLRNLGGEVQYLWSTVKWGRLGFCYPLRPFPNPNSGEFQGMERLFSFVTQKEYWGFPGGSAVKNPPANAGNIGSGRSPGEGNGNPLQYSCLENPMDREAWRATVHGVADSWTQLSD